RGQVASLPVVVIRVVPQLVVKQRALPFQKLGKIPSRTHLQEKFIAIFGVVVEGNRNLGRLLGLLLRLEGTIKTEVGGEHECPTMVGIIALNDVGNGGL